MNNNKLYIDIGGNGVQYQINDEKIKSFSTTNKDKAYVLGEIARIANDNKVEYISVSSPGAANNDTGYISGISGIKGYGNFNFYDEIRPLLKYNETKLYITNDANCGLLYSLKNSKYKNAVQISIGTGIGGAIALDGKLIHGRSGYAGEFGYSLNPYNDNNLSIETSSNALVKMFGTKYKNAKEIFEKEINSNEIREWFRRIAILTINIQYSFDPEVIFISGGVTQNNQFIKGVKSAISYINKSHMEITNLPNVVIINAKNSALEGTKQLAEMEKNV